MAPTRHDHDFTLHLVKIIVLLFSLSIASDIVSCMEWNPGVVVGIIYKCS